SLHIYRYLIITARFQRVSSLRVGSLASSKWLGFQLAPVKLGTLPRFDHSFPLLRGRAGHWQPGDIGNGIAGNMLLGLAIAPVKQGTRRRNPGRIRCLGIVHDRDKRIDSRWHVFSRQLFDLGNLLWSPSRIPALAFLKWSCCFLAVVSCG